MRFDKKRQGSIYVFFAILQPPPDMLTSGFHSILSVMPFFQPRNSSHHSLEEMKPQSFVPSSAENCILRASHAYLASRHMAPAAGFENCFQWRLIPRAITSACPQQVLGETGISDNTFVDTSVLLLCLRALSSFPSYLGWRVLAA
jgi:hypothetical protein